MNKKFVNVGKACNQLHDGYTMNSTHSFIGLVSGGKDSIFSIYKLVKAGHKLVCLANLYPKEFNEIDSFMFQCAGSEIVECLQDVMDVPLYRKQIVRSSKCVAMHYQYDEKDEIEDLFDLLREIKCKHPNVTAVSCGAIESNYQNNRLNDVCQRLNFVSLCPLWKLNQSIILKDMISSGMESIVIKTACLGLVEHHLGHPINNEFYDYMQYLNGTYGVHICGEGGEYESMVLYCPMIFKKRIRLKKCTRCVFQPDKLAPVQTLKIEDIELIPV